MTAEAIAPDEPPTIGADDDRLADALARSSSDGVDLFWLGQAGFLIRHEERVILIDPYLSDTLAARYRGRRFDHARMTPPPIAPDAIPRVDLVLCTHRHGDHMDPGTLDPIAARFPSCRFVVPAAERAHAAAIGLPMDRVELAVAGVPFVPWPKVDIVPVPAAHERRERDATGRDRYLGYGIALGGVGFYHSGDSVPFDGLIDAVRALGVAIALLPVNGRDAERAVAGVPGNFTLDEAVALCRDAGIRAMVAHHWGLFAFNTIDPAQIDAHAAVAADRDGLRVLRPTLGRGWRFG